MIKLLEFKQSYDDVINYLSTVEDFSRDGLQNTPQRIFKSRLEMFSGYKQNPNEILNVTFSDECDDLIVMKDIEFYSTCEHHWLPFFGKVHIGYIPNENRVVGASKLARLVDCFSKRLQIQERMTRQIANSVMTILQPSGVIVVVNAKHLCMMMRGAQKQDSSFVTSCALGLFRSDGHLKNEFFSLCR